MNCLPNNMRSFRKEKGMTQMQLAEALNVSVGVISKWELGISSPDIDTIVLMARLFDVSIDVLVGYELSYKSINNYREQIREYLEDRRFDDCISEVDVALKKYPNDYSLVYYCAGVFLNIGGATHADKYLKRSLELYELSLNLFDPSRHDANDRAEIMDYIARIHIALGNVDPALTFLIDNNFHGKNDDLIGYIIATEKHDSAIALEYLDKGFISSIDCIFRTCIGYSAAFCDNTEYEKALSVLQWLQAFFESIYTSKEICFLDKSYILLLCEISIVYARQQNPDEAKAILEEAVDRAIRFDANPKYDLSGLKFVNIKNSIHVFDDFGETAMDGINYFIQKNDDLTKGLLSTIRKKVYIERQIAESPMTEPEAGI